MVDTEFEDSNPLKYKALRFSIRIYKLSKLLIKRKEFQIADQVLRSGTSIGANIQEAHAGQSKKDFYSKLTIAYKEAKETQYWIRLLKEVGVLKTNEFESLYFDCEELAKIIASCRKTINTKYF